MLKKAFKIVFFAIIIQFLLISSVSAEEKKNYTDNEILVKYKNSDKFQLLKSENLKTAELIEKYKDNPSIEYIQPNFQYKILTQETPWGVSTQGVQADIAASNNGASGSGIVVAVIDTGVYYNHEDLEANMWSAPEYPNHGWDFVGETGDNDPVDDNGHGTHVAGIIAADDNDVGVIGVAPEAKIMAVKVLDSSGYGYSTDIIEGINFAIENHANIINLSIGGYSYDMAEKIAIDNAVNAGITVVAAAGNESENLLSYPAGFENTIAVAAIQETADQINPNENMDTRLANFSNYGFIDVAAPGRIIYSTYLNGTYTYMSGTSMACPHVAGVAALIMEKQPLLTPLEVKRVIEETAMDLGETGRDQYFGSGLANANAATSALSKKIILSANFREDNPDPTLATIYNSQIIPADAESTSKIRAYLIDENGNSLNDIIVNFSSNKGILNANTATTDANGMAEVMLTSSETAGTAIITANADTFSQTTINVDLANILLVSDSSEWQYGNNFSWFYETALQNLDQKFIRWDTYRYDETTNNFPSADYLSKFALVIWYTGDLYVNNAAQAELKTFMDNGGSLLISGPDILYYINNGYASDNVFGDYFKISFSGDSPTNINPVTGANILNNISATLSDPGYLNNFYPDYIALASGSNAIFNYSDGSVAGSYVDSTYKNAYLGFGLESIFLKAERESVLQALLTYFNISESEENNVINIDAPINLHSSLQKAKQITLSWEAPAGDPDSYYISYGTNSTADNIGIIDTGSNSSEYTITNLISNKNYYFKVSAVKEGESYNYSEIANIRTRPLKVKKINITFLNPGQAVISWKRVRGRNIRYRLELMTKKNKTLKAFKTTKKNITIKNLSVNKIYKIKIRATHKTTKLTGKWSKTKKLTFL